jgi:oxygen-independent coproporphyrinogen III oxidase
MSLNRQPGPAMAKTISLYVHIPFCKKKCRYCDFYSIPMEETLAFRYVDAVIQEWRKEKKAHDLGCAQVKTIYFGGGTPSLLSVELWKKLWRGITGDMEMAPDIEASIECNPDSFSEEKASVWVESGINRLTVGVQSLIDRELLFLGRPHDVAQALAVLNNRVFSRYASIVADIMYGLPGQSVESLNSTLDILLQTPCIAHLSAYELTINPHTPFGRHQKILPLPTEAKSIEMLDIIIDKCNLIGMNRYEISNFARSNHRSKHNSAYWLHEPYIGLGPAAHSYLHPKRWANVPDVREYVLNISSHKPPRAFEESIGTSELSSECIMLGLRTIEGISRDRYQSLTGASFDTPERGRVLASLVREEMVVDKEDFIAPTRRGMLFADSLAKRLA